MTTYILMYIIANLLVALISCAVSRDMRWTTAFGGSVLLAVGMIPLILFRMLSGYSRTCW